MPTSGSSSFSEISTNGFPPLHVGDIEISLEQVSTIPNLHAHKNLVATKEKDDEAKLLDYPQPHEDLGVNESYRSYLDISMGLKEEFNF